MVNFAVPTAGFTFPGRGVQQILHHPAFRKLFCCLNFRQASTESLHVAAAHTVRVVIDGNTIREFC